VKRRAFGWTKRKVPVLGLGTWQMEGDDRAACVRALRRGLDLGMTHIDTAELYGSGKVEEIVREAIEGRRDEVFLVSKVMPSNASRRGVIQACDRSLRRLGTDRLDCYLLHWPGSHPLEDTIASFEDLVHAGKIKTWGVSNFDEEELAQALAIAGPARIACNQVLYHLGERAIEHGVIPWCEEHDVAVVAYSPFGAGHFPSASSKGGRVLAKVAEAAGMSARQVALAFLTRRPSLFAIPKASREAHVAENAGAGDLVLSAEHVRDLEAAFPLGPRRSLPSL
jgi:diketogulonate reductase-like aldo/keto reductase